MELRRSASPPVTYIVLELLELSTNQSHEYPGNPATKWISWATLERTRQQVTTSSAFWEYSPHLRILRVSFIAFCSFSLSMRLTKWRAKP